jgi:cell cycle sensor histidine kinase DivJ
VPPGRGTGLGLAICRSITEAHGGRMTIERKLGAGTAVSIRLLLCPPGT